MAKNVQISYDLFVLLLRYHLLELTDDKLQHEIKTALENKLDALVKHDLYSKSKDHTLTPAEREEARKAYLDRVGIRDSFRW